MSPETTRWGIPAQMADRVGPRFKARYAEWVRDNSAPAIELKRQFPDGPVGRSFLGGVPTLPDGMDWPRDADGLPMAFLGQIDCATLPHPPDSLLPRDGVLFFFYDSAAGGDGGGPTEVLFAAGSRDVPDREAEVPEGLSRLGESSGERLICGGWTFTTFHAFEPREVPRFHFPKFRVSAQLVDSVRYPFRQDGLDWDLSAAIAYRLSAEISAEEFNVDWLRHDAPSIFGLPQIVSPVEDEIGATGTGWPWAWDAAALIIHNQHRFRLPNWKRSGGESWLDRAERAGMRAPMAVGDAAEFRRWFTEGRFAHNSEGVLLPYGAAHWKAAEGMFKFEEGYLAQTTMDAISLLVDARENRAHLIPQEVLAQGEPMLRASGRHQMLGCGKLVQGAAEEHSDDVLLLQLASDYGMLAMWGDVGYLQFWISREDLAARRFDRVTFTLEGA